MRRSKPSSSQQETKETGYGGQSGQKELHLQTLEPFVKPPKGAISTLSSHPSLAQPIIFRVNPLLMA